MRDFAVFLLLGSLGFFSGVLLHRVYAYCS